MLINLKETERLPDQEKKLSWCEKISLELSLVVKEH